MVGLQGVAVRLTEREPRWIKRDGAIDGVSFDCPCAKCLTAVAPCVPRRVYVLFAASPEETADERRWGKTGETFDNLTLTPSIDMSASGHWHGFLQNGDLT